MAIRPIVLERKPSTGSVLAFSRSGISLSAAFISENKLENKEGIKFFRDDDDEYWLGFRSLTKAVTTPYRHQYGAG